MLLLCRNMIYSSSELMPMAMLLRLGKMQLVGWRWDHLFVVLKVTPIACRMYKNSASKSSSLKQSKYGVLWHFLLYSPNFLACDLFCTWYLTYFLSMCFVLLKSIHVLFFYLKMHISLPFQQMEAPLQHHGGRLEHNETYCGSCYGAQEVCFYLLWDNICPWPTKYAIVLLPFVSHRLL